MELTFPSRLAWMHDILKIIETLVLEAGAADLARDMTLCGNPLSRSLLGVKRTWLVAAHMSAFDPKRTLSLELLLHKTDSVAFCRCQNSRLNKR